MGNTYLFALNPASYDEIAIYQLIFAGGSRIYLKDLNGNERPEILVLGEMRDGGNHPGARIDVFEYSGSTLKWLDLGAKNAAGNSSPLVVNISLDIADLTGDGVADLRAEEAIYGPEDPLCCPGRIDTYILRWDGRSFVKDTFTLTTQLTDAKEYLHSVGEEQVLDILFDESVEPPERIRKLKGFTGIDDDQFIGLLTHAALEDEYFVDPGDLRDGSAELVPYREIENGILQNVREEYFEGKEPNPLLRAGIGALTAYNGISLTKEEKDVAALATAVYGRRLLASTLGEPLVDRDGRELYPIGEASGQRIYLPTLLPDESAALLNFYNTAQQNPGNSQALAINFLQQHMGVSITDLKSFSGVDPNSGIDMERVDNFVNGMERLGADIDLGRTFRTVDIDVGGFDNKFKEFTSDLFDN